MVLTQPTLELSITIRMTMTALIILTKVKEMPPPSRTELPSVRNGSWKMCLLSWFKQAYVSSFRKLCIVQVLVWPTVSFSLLLSLPSVCVSLCGPTPGPGKCSSPWPGERKRQEAQSLSSLGQECAPVARYDSLVCIRTKCKFIHHFLSKKCSEVMWLGRYCCGARMWWCFHSMPNIY